MLFELIVHRYEHGCLLSNTNQPFSEWDNIFGDNMMTVVVMDRLVLQADIYQIEADSYQEKYAIKSNLKLPRLIDPNWQK